MKTSKSPRPKITEFVKPQKDKKKEKEKEMKPTSKIEAE